jgi:tetracycline 7-halogenase / FADH2 O2-dependent halogenase
MTPDEPFDVAVLGGHLTGGLLATILARHGVRVLVVPAEGDRTEPSGDSTVPYTTAVFQLLAERFDVPEVGAFAHFTDLPDWVQQSSGIKKSLAFLYHHEGRPHVPEHTVQFHVPGEHNEWHLYRPAVDVYALQLARKRGATVVEGTARRVDLTADGAVVVCADGQRYAARYVVDAAGTDRPLLSTVDDGGLVLRSRVLSTHMVGVPPFENLVPLADYGAATAFSTGTVHHLFDGGWVQVVDYGNHGLSTNTLAGVTVGLDPGRYALPADPETAFRTLVGRFPGLAAQFDGALASRDWVVADRWQRRAAVTYGDRWIAIERSASRTDEFLSRDVTMSAEVVHALAAALLRILAGADARTELGRVARFQDALIDFNDSMLAAARTATRDFALWNAYTRVWLLWQILAHLSLKREMADAAAGDGTWAQVERFEQGALWFGTPRGLTGLLDWFFDQFAQVRAGVLKEETAAKAIFARLRRERFVPPLYRFGHPPSRFYHFTMPRRLLMLAWVKTVAPEDFKRLLTRDNVTGRRAERTPAPTQSSPVR